MNQILGKSNSFVRRATTRSAAMPHTHTRQTATVLTLGLPDVDGRAPTLVVRAYCCGYAVVLHGQEHTGRRTHRIDAWETWTQNGLIRASDPGEDACRFYPATSSASP